jgi:hypothetical protein
MANAQCFRIALNWTAALAGVLAALFWFRSATVKVVAQSRTDGGMQSAQITVDGADFIATAVQQTRWNKWAAMAAACAAASQAIALMLPV